MKNLKLVTVAMLAFAGLAARPAAAAPSNYFSLPLPATAYVNASSNPDNRGISVLFTRTSINCGTLVPQDTTNGGTGKSYAKGDPCTSSTASAVAFVTEQLNLNGTTFPVTISFSDSGNGDTTGVTLTNQTDLSSTLRLDIAVAAGTAANHILSGAQFTPAQASFYVYIVPTIGQTVDFNQKSGQYAGTLDVVFSM